MAEIYIAEIRFNPSPKFLDIRGEIIEKLLTSELNKWSVKGSRIEIENDEGLIFYSVSNLGFLCKSNVDYFIGRLDASLKILGDRNPVRWGYRINKIVETEVDFSALLSSFKNKLLKLENSRLPGIKGNLEDVGVTYIFKEDRDSVRINIGPMEEGQAKELFPDQAVPPNGIFMDIDFFRNNDDFYNADYRRSRVLDFIRKSKKESEGIISKLEEMIND